VSHVVHPLDEVAHSNVPCSVEFRLTHEFVTETRISDLFKQLFWEIGLSHLLDCLLERHLRRGVLDAEQLLKLLNSFELEWCNLNFDFEACTKLVLDVLG